MSRYLGPIYKKSRRLNFSILENNSEFRRKKNAVLTNKWKRKSAYANQLEEKQRVRYRYHLSEKQLRNTFKRILKKTGIQSNNLLIELEQRLDNIVYRLGLAATRRASRQLVNHGHVLVNNRKIDIPSYILKVGDIISLKKDKIKNSLVIKNSWNNKVKYNFVQLDEKNLVGRLNSIPNIEELNLGINGALVVEYYNRFI